MSDSTTPNPTDELAVGRTSRESQATSIADLAERARARYIRPESDSDRAINFLSGEWATYALEHDFTDLCMVHASTDELNQFMRVSQLAFFAGVIAERETTPQQPSSAPVLSDGKRPPPAELAGFARDMAEVAEKRGPHTTLPVGAPFLRQLADAIDAAATPASDSPAPHKPRPRKCWSS